MPLLMALAVFAAAPPAAIPADWHALVERLKKGEGRDALAGMDEEFIPFLRRADRHDLEVDERLRLFAAAGAIRERHWGFVRAMGPGAEIKVVTHGYWFNRVRFTPDGKLAVVGGGALILYDLATGKELGRVMEVGGARPAVAVSPDGKLALTGHAAQKHADLVELPSLKPVRKLAGHEGGEGAGMSDVEFSPDGKIAASCAGGGIVLLHDVKSGEEKLRIKADRGVPHSLAFSPDGKRLLVGGGSYSADASSRLWVHDANTGKLLRSIRLVGGVASKPRLLPDGERALVATSSGQILMLRLSDGKELRRMDHRDHVTDLALSPDGTRAASAGHHGRLIRIWDVESGRLVYTFEGHMSPVRGVTFSPDGTRLLSCDAVACVRLWKVGRR